MYGRHGSAVTNKKAMAKGNVTRVYMEDLSREFNMTLQKLQSIRKYVIIIIKRLLQEIKATIHGQPMAQLLRNRIDQTASY